MQAVVIPADYNNRTLCLCVLYKRHQSHDLRNCPRVTRVETKHWLYQVSRPGLIPILVQNNNWKQCLKRTRFHNYHSCLDFKCNCIKKKGPKYVLTAFFVILTWQHLISVIRSCCSWILNGYIVSNLDVIHGIHLFSCNTWA